MTSLPALLFLCVVAVTTGQYTGQLRTGAFDGAAIDIYGYWWIKQPVSSPSNSECNLDGVFRFAFQPTGYRSDLYIQLQMSTDKITGWTFNLGDSQTNDGYGGDDGRQFNNAEVHSIGRTILIYAKANVGGGGNELLYAQDNFFKGDIEIGVRDEHFRARAGRNFIYIDSPRLFQLKDQADPKGVNCYVYMGLNRVADIRSNRVGSGLCKFRTNWEPLISAWKL